MDAAQKIIKNSVILTAAALIMAAAGSAQTPALSVPLAVTLAGSGGQTVQVTSTVAGTEITYAITTVYANDGAGVQWLRVDAPSTPVTPTVLTFSLTRAPITAGTYTANVTLTPTAPSGVAPVTIVVTYTSGSSGGGGSSTLTASPNPVNLFAGLNSVSPATSVAITSSSTALLTITSAVPTLITGTSFNWLSATVTNSSVGAGSNGSISLTATSTGLPTGTYTANVTVTPNSGTALVLPVNFTVGSNGGTGNWSVSPASATLNYTTGGAFPSQAVSVTPPNNAGSYRIDATSSNGWLLLSVSGSGDSTSFSAIPSNTPFTLKVGSNVSVLTQGSYSGYVTLTDSNSASYRLDVTLNVNGGTSNGLTISPNPVSLSTTLGGSEQAQTVTIRSTAGGALSVLGVGATPSWLRTTPGPYPPSLAANEQFSFVVYANPSGLTAGSYSSSIAVTIGAQSSNLTVNFTVGSGGGGTGTWNVSPSSIAWTYTKGGGFNSQDVSVGLSSGATSYNVAATSSNGWLLINYGGSDGQSFNGIPSGTGFTLHLGSNVNVLTEGTYTGQANLTDSNGLTYTLTVSLSVTTGTTAGLTISPNPVSFNVVSSAGEQQQVVNIQSNTGGALSVTAIGTTPSWLRFTPTTIPPSLAANQQFSLTVFANPAGLTAGAYSAAFAITVGTQTGTLTVNLVVGTGGGTGGTVTASPASLNFTAQQGSNPAATQSITVSSASGTAGIPFTVQVSSGGNWLFTDATTTKTTQASFTVNVVSASLLAGTYNGNIQVIPTGGSTVNIPVTLTIAPLPTVTATPTSLTFDYRAGDSAPAAKQITVSGGTSLAYTASASSTGNWLVVSPTSGTTPGTVNVSINTTGLATGSYNGTVIVAGASGAAGSTTISVSLNVTAPLPTLSRVTNAASYASGSIAPGEIITLFASDPTHPIGPATAVGLTLDSTGKVATTIGGVQVLIQGYLCPMVYASATQVAAVVPYEVKFFSSASVVVKFLGQSSNGVQVNVATTVPGLFTTNASGTGPGAILNSNGVPNAPNNPATRGDTVVIYMTGEGETSPAGVTGKVTTVAAPPQPLTPGPLLPVSVTIGGQPANWTFAGEAPGFVSGAMQVNVIVPTNIAAGEQPVVVSIGGTPSQQGVTVSVR